MPRSEAEVHALLQKLRGRGDPFGVAGDPELQRIALDTAFMRYKAEPTPMNLTEWLGALSAAIALGTSIEALRAVYEPPLRSIAIDRAEAEAGQFIAGLLASFEPPPALHGIAQRLREELEEPFEIEHVPIEDGWEEVPFPSDLVRHDFQPSQLRRPVPQPSIR